MGPDERLARLEGEVLGLRRRLEGMDARLGTLEGGAAAPIAAAPTAAMAAAAAAAVGTPPAPEDHAGRAFLADLGLVGRTLMVLGGGFLLRAVTETAAVADAAGVGLGFAYAVLWLALAGLATRRAAGRAAGRSATYHALAFTLLAFPLVAEAVLRFAVVPPAAGAAVLAAAAAAGLAVSVHRGLRLAAWLVTAGAVGAAWVLLLAAGSPAAYCAVLLALAAATLWLGEHAGWRGLRWLAAAAADVALLLPLVLVAHDRWTGPLAVLVGLQLALPLVYAGTFSRLSRSRPAWRVGPFELLQTAAALAVGYGGAVWVAHRVPTLAPWVAAGGLLLAAAAFAAAAISLRRRAERRPAFLYHAAVGCPLLLGATGLLLPATAEALLWTAVAVLLALAAARLASVSLAAMAALFTGFAAASSGLLRQGLWSLGAPATLAWPPLGAAAAAVLAAVAAMLLLALPRRSPFWGRAAVAPRLALLVFLAIGLAGTALALAASSLAGVPGTAAVDAGVLAALRTAVLAALALLAAVAARRPRLAEARLLVYPLLALGALKLAVEDLPMGRPATLFAALAVYGAALIAAPRLLPGSAAKTTEAG